MIFFNRYLLGVTFLALFVSCKDDTDTISPQVNWLFPANNKTFSTLDEIFIEAEISDNESLTAVRLALFKKENDQQIQANEVIVPNASNFRFAVNFQIKDTLLESGEYYFKVLAEDGENVKASFRFIRIETIPKKRLNTIVACRGVGDIVQHYKASNDFVFSSFFSDSKSLTEAITNSIDQHYWIVSKLGGFIKVYHLKENKLEYEREVLSNFSTLFTTADLYDRTVFIGGNDGEIRGFNERFNENFTYRPNDFGRSILNLKANEKYLLAEEADINGSNRTLQVILRNSGFLRAQLALFHRTKAIYFTGKEKAILFQNNADGGLLSDVTIEANGIRTMKTIRDSILRVVQVSHKDYFISTASKIVRYDFSSNSSFDFLQLPNAVIEYDELNNQLLIGSNQTFSVYSLNSGSIVTQRTLPSEIIDIAVRFNR